MLKKVEMLKTGWTVGFWHVNNQKVMGFTATTFLVVIKKQ